MTVVGKHCAHQRCSSLLKLKSSLHALVMFNTTLQKEIIQEAAWKVSLNTLFCNTRCQKWRFDVILNLLNDYYDSKPGRLYPTRFHMASGGVPRCQTAARNMYLHGYPSPCFTLTPLVKIQGFISLLCQTPL